MSRVLVVEHDTAVADQLSAELRAAGLDVTLLRDGQSGLVRAVTDRFDVVVVSAELPGIDGFRICDRLRKDPTVGRIPIFLIGGHEAQAEAHRQKPMPADEYFRKPVKPNELVPRLRAALAAPRMPPPAPVPQGLTTGVTTRATRPIEAPKGATADPNAARRGNAAAGDSRGLAELRYELAASRRRGARAEEAVVSARASLLPPTPDAKKDDVRERLAMREAELAKLAATLNIERQTASTLREEVQKAEASEREAMQALRQSDLMIGQLERHVATSRFEQDQAKKRADELTRRLEQLRADLEGERVQLAEAQRARNEARALQVIELNALRAEVERGRSDAQRQAAEELRAREAAHAEELARLREENDRTNKAWERDTLARDAEHARQLAEAVANADRTARAEVRALLVRAEVKSEQESDALAKKLEAERALAAEHRRAAETASAEVLSLVQGRAEVEARLAELDGLANEAAERAARQIAELRGALIEARSAEAMEREVRSAQEEELQRTRNEHNVALGAQRRAEQRIAELEAQALAERAGTTRSHAVELQKLGQERDAVRSGLKAEIERRRVEAESRLSEVLFETEQRMRAEHERALEQERNTRIATVEQMDREHAIALARLREEHLALREKGAADYLARMSAVEERWSRELSTFTEQVSTTIATEREGRARAEAQAAELERKRALAEAEMTQVRAAITASEAAIEALRDELETARGAELTVTLERHEREIRAAHEAELAELRRNHASRIADEESALAEARVEHEAAANRLRLEVARAKDDAEAASRLAVEKGLAEARAEHTAELEALQRDVRQRDAAMAERAEALAAERVAHAKAIAELTRSAQESRAVLDQARAEDASRHTAAISALEQRHAQELVTLREALAGSEAEGRRGVLSAMEEREKQLAERDRQLVAERERHVAELEEQTRTFEKRLEEEARMRARLEASHAEGADVARRDHQAEIDSLQAAIGAARQERATMLQALRAETDAARIAAEEAHAEAIAQVRGEIEGRYRKLLEERSQWHATEIATLRKTADDAAARASAVLSTTEEERGAENQRLRSALEAEARARADDRARHTEAILQLEAAKSQEKSRLADTIARIEAEARAEREDLIDRHTVELADREASLEIARDFATVAINGFQREAEARQGAAMHALREELDAAKATLVADLATKHDAELGALRQGAARAAEMARKELDEATADFARQTSELEKQLAALAEGTNASHEQAIAELRKQLEAERSQAVIEVERRAAAELATARDEAAIAIATATDAHHQAIEAKDSIIAELQDVHERLFARQTEELDRARTEALARLEAELEAKRRRDLDEAAAAHAQALAAVRAESENHAVHAGRAVAAAHAQSALALAHALAAGDEAAATRLEAQKRELEAQFEAEREAQKTRHQNDLAQEREKAERDAAERQREAAALAAQHAEALAARDALLAYERETHDGAQAQFFEDAERGREQALRRLRSELEGKLLPRIAELEAQKARAEEAAARELEEAREEHVIALAAKDQLLARERAEKTKALEAANATAAEAQAAAMERTTAELAERHQTALADASKRHDEALSQLRVELAAKIDEHAARLKEAEELLAKERESHARAIADLGRQGDEAKTNALDLLRIEEEERHADTLRELEKRHAQDIAAKGRELDALRAGHGQDIAALQASFEAERKMHASTVAELRTAMEEALSATERALTAQVETMEATRVDNEKRHEELSAALGGARDALQKERDAREAERATHREALLALETERDEALENVVQAHVDFDRARKEHELRSQAAGNQFSAELKQREATLVEAAERAKREREADAARHAEELTRRDAQLADERAAATRAAAEIASEREAAAARERERDDRHTRLVATLEAHHATEILAMNAELENVRRHATESVESSVTEHAREIESRDKEISALRDGREKLERDLAALEKARADLEAEREGLQRRHDAAVAELERKQGDASDELKAALEAADNRERTAREEAAAALERERAALAARAAQTATAHERAIEDQKQAAERARAEHERMRAAEAESHARALADLKRKHESEVASLGRDRDAEAAEIRAAADAAVVAADRAKRQAEAATDERAAAQKRIEELEARLEETRRDVDKSRGTLEELTNARNEAAARAEREKAAHRRAVVALVDANEEVRVQNERLIASQESDYRDLLAQLDRHASELEARLRVVDADREGLRKGAAAALEAHRDELKRRDELLEKERAERQNELAERNKLEEQMKAERARLKREAEAAQQKVADDLEARQAVTITTLVKENDTKLRTVTERLEKAVAAHAADLKDRDEKIAAMNAENQKHLEEHRRALEGVRADERGRTDAVKARYTRLTDELRTALDRAEKTAAAKLEEERAVHTSAVRALEAAIARERAVHSEQLRESTRALPVEDALESTAELRAERDLLDAQLLQSSRVLEDLQREHDRKLAALRQGLEEEKRAAIAQIREETSVVLAERDEAIEKLITRHRATKADTDNAHDATRAKVAELSAEVTAARTQIARKDEELSRTTQSLRAAAQELAAERGRRNKETRESTQQADELRALRAELDGAKAALETKRLALETDLRNANARETSLKQEIARLRAASGERASELGKELESARAEIATMGSTLANLQKQQQPKEPVARPADLDRLRAAVQRLEGEAARLRDQNEQLEETLRARTAEVTAQTRALELAREAALKNDEQIARLRDDLESNAESIPELGDTDEDETINKVGAHPADEDERTLVAAGKQNDSMPVTLPRGADDAELERAQRHLRAEKARHAARTRELELELLTTRNEMSARMSALVQDQSQRLQEWEQVFANQSTRHAEAIEEMNQRFSRELAAMRKSHNEELSRAQTGQKTRARDEAAGEHAKQLESAIAQLRTELDQAHATHDSSQEQWSARWRSAMRENEEARAALAARVHALTTDFASVREQLDFERRERMTEQSESSERLAALEELAAGQREALEAAQRALGEARTEIPQLETEITALRAALVDARRQLDDDITETNKR